MAGEALAEVGDEHGRLTAGELGLALTRAFRYPRAAMERTLFSEEHELFRKSFQKFLAQDVLPHQERWREAGVVDRDAWKKAEEVDEGGGG